MIKTIKESREQALVDFCNNTGAPIEQARRMVNSYYRFCGLEERLLYLENDERTYNKRYTRELQEKQERWIARLQGELKKYGCKMVWFGYLPTICYIGTTATALESFFY